MNFSRNLWRSLLFLTLIAALCGVLAMPLLAPVQAAPQLQAATNIVISEFRTRGANGAADEFIEIYNPTSAPISIGDWEIRVLTGSGAEATRATIPSGVTLISGQHYLITNSSGYSGTVTADLSYTTGVVDDGGVAIFDDLGNRIDSVGTTPGSLYTEGTNIAALTQDLDQSYERKIDVSGVCIDSNNNASDFFLRNASDPQNFFDPLILCGNPTQTPTITNTPNVTPTRTPTRTKTPVPTRTPTRTPTSAPAQLVAINEFVPRPGRDWNNDGLINAGDEFIELINHGTISVNISGWTLDDEANTGSKPFVLPARVLQPGERVVFYGSVTNLLLSDGGDGVRLLKQNGSLIDAFNYKVVNYPDQSFCRLPDNGGLDDWNRNCYPTPGLPNSLGSAPGSASGVNASLCPVADTLPHDFYLAECAAFGNNIWSRLYWDNTGWYGEMDLPNYPGKWETFVD